MVSQIDLKVSFKKKSLYISLFFLFEKFQVGPTLGYFWQHFWRKRHQNWQQLRLYRPGHQRDPEDQLAVRMHRPLRQIHWSCVQSFYVQSKNQTVRDEESS